MLRRENGLPRYGNRHTSGSSLQLRGIGASYDDLLAFPEDAQDDLGYTLYLAQTGELLVKAKPMCGALRDVVGIIAGTCRLMYTVKLGDVSYVLYAFLIKS